MSHARKTHTNKLIALAAAALLASCAQHNDDHSLTQETVIAIDAHPERNTQDRLRNEIGRQFIVEHFEAQANDLMLQAIAQHRPAGFVFWNSNKVGGQQLREVIRTYANKSSTTGDKKGLLYSTDYEGGGLSFTENAASIAGIQRFKLDMTLLAHPQWMEKSMPQFGTELCKLHGELMAKELTSIGINYPLTMVSDLSNALFTLRSISKDPAKISACLQASMNAFFDNGHIIFVTKHFPGLGQTRGDTHDGTVISRVTNIQDEQQHLKPFIDLINNSKAKNHPELLSILASHAEVPVFDSQNLTTESSKILRGVMRQKMGFGGLIVSDAMWMGDYEPHSLTQMLPIYLNSFISGMDILMIKGNHFAGAVEFFRQVYDNEVTPEQQAAIEARTKLSFADVRTKLLARMKESSQRLDLVLAKIGDARAQMTKGAPKQETTAIRQRYYQILEATDVRWKTVIDGLDSKPAVVP